MALITLLTDFGRQDHYVAALKARVINHSENQKIIDISHEIRPCDIAQAAYVLKSVFKDFPEGTIHVIGVGSSLTENNKFIAVELEKHFFIAPDNGIISLISSEKPKKIVLINNKQKVNPTFSTKLLLIPAACLLAEGKSIFNLGEKINEMALRRPAINLSTTEDRIYGNAAHIDSYGNIITDIDINTFQMVGNNRKFVLQFAYESFYKIHKHYQDVYLGDCVALFNSDNLLEIAINQGNASELLGIKYGSPIIIKFSKT